MLHLRLLGPPEVRLDGTLFNEITSKKSLALLFYLVMTGRNHLRDELACLFWYDMPDAQARKNLRNILPPLRALLGPHLSITRHTVGFNRAAPYWLDIEQFCVAFEGDWTSLGLTAASEAITLYGGDFLTGFYVPDAPAFEEWMISQRDHLNMLATRSLSSFAEAAFQQGAHQEGLAATQRLLRLEPWNEKAHLLQMELLVALGERDRALMQYDLCRRALASEFGVEPDQQTTAVYRQIKAGQPMVGAQDDQLVHSVGAPAPQKPAPRPLRVGLPDLTTLHGREEEIRRLHHWIVGEQCRLVMLSGRVGVGKTALARHIAQVLHQPDRSIGYAQILWHSLREMHSPDQLLDDWLDQLDPRCRTADRRQRESLLLEQLRQRRCLLVIDDIERLTDPIVVGAWGARFWRLVEGIVLSEHQSCLLLVGRELPPLCTYFEATSSVVRLLCLEGLGYEAGEQLLQPYGLTGSPALKRRLIDQHDGTPLFLHLAARSAQNLSHGDLEVYASESAPLCDVIQTVLDAEFAALEPLEQTILNTLASVWHLLVLPELHQALYHSVMLPELLNAVQRLKRRSLLVVTSEGFGLPRLIRAYVQQRVDLMYIESRASERSWHSAGERQSPWLQQ